MKFTRTRKALTTSFVALLLIGGGASAASAEKPVKDATSQVDKVKGGKSDDRRGDWW